jgi:methionyl aminopeptidase
MAHALQLRLTPLLAVARECGRRAALPPGAAPSLAACFSTTGGAPRPLAAAKATHAPSARPPPAAATNRRPATSISRSRFSDKRGQVHGCPFRVFKGALSPPRAVPPAIARPPYAVPGGDVPREYPPPTVHGAAGRDAMRRAGAVAASVLARAGELVRAGVTTDELDAAVHALSVAAGAYPSPLGYAGFPKSVCASVNEVVCHGIPDDTVVMAGDLVKLDVSCFIGGVHGDTCRTFVAGSGGGGGASSTDFAGSPDLDAGGRHLALTTKAALDAAIKLCGPGVPIHAVGASIAAALAGARLEGVSAFAGHGIGGVFHTEPIVHHHVNDSPYIMRPGMTFTIEPMVTEGSGEVALWGDGWTVVTADGGRAAQFEHTLLVTEHGVEVLTAYE